MGIVNMELRRK